LAKFVESIKEFNATQKKIIAISDVFWTCETSFAPSIIKSVIVKID